MEVGRRRELTALAWGFAEATLFFVIPDVLLTFFAAGDRRAAIRGCFWAFAGALVGGVAMYLFGALQPAAAERLLAAVPQVGEASIERVEGEIARLGPWAVVRGPLTATPYKIYSTLAGKTGMAVGWLLLASIPARLGRFLVVTAIAGWLFAGPLSSWSLGRRRLGLAIFWVAVYAALWALVWR